MAITHAYSVCMGMHRSRRLVRIPSDNGRLLSCCHPRMLVCTQARCLCFRVVLFANLMAEKGFAPRRKAPSCDGAKRAAGLQGCMSASCTQSVIMCGMHAFCARHQHTHVVSATQFCVLAYFFCVSLSLSCLFSFSVSPSLTL